MNNNKAQGFVIKSGYSYYFQFLITALLITCLPVAYSIPPQNESDPNAVAVSMKSAEQTLTDTQSRLLADFNGYLKTSGDYKKLVEENCSLFPEGDLFPYVYPTLAYVNIALKDSSQRKNSVLQAEKLIDLAIISVVKRVRPPEGRLENLRFYQNHATYLGQLNLALGAYYLISDDERYSKLHTVLSDVLHAAIVETEGRSLNSFPDYSWPFDTIPVLVSLHLYDMKTSTKRSRKMIDQHLEWVRDKASHPRYELPYSRIDNATGKGREFPRGCDLSFRLCFLSHLNQVYARRLYEKYTASHWIDNGLLAGFSEWPKGVNRFEDIDSGPIVMGVGLGATGMGLAATIACKDDQRFNRLCNEMLTSAGLIRTLLVTQQMFFSSGKASQRQAVPLDPQYFSGFLFGDTMLFYCVTWQQWSQNVLEHQ